MKITNYKKLNKKWQDTRKGQVLVIFALTAVVLFAVIGIAIDAGISYFHNDKQESAASAAALSGVSYLPGDFPDAEQEALLTASRDGYVTSSGLPSNQSTTVSVWQPSGTTNELEVSISAPAEVYFLGIFGFEEHQVISYATAEYLPPIQMGQPGNQLGTTMGDSSGDLGLGGYYFLRSEGWGNPRSEGDPFTPTPDDSANSCGTSDTSCIATTPDVHQVSCIAGDDLCNGDQNGASNTDCGTANNLCLNDTGGQNYLIYVPASTTANINVYNPSFDPGDDTNCTSQTASCLNTFHEDDSSFPTLSSISGSSEPPATDFDAMGYTLFAVPDINDRTQDIPLEQDIFCPFNAYNLDQGIAQYSYYKEGRQSGGCNPKYGSSSATLTTVSGTPTQYNSPTETAPNWISLNSYSPTGANANLFTQTYNILSSESSYATDIKGTYYLSGGSSGQYFRLRVDTLAWNGTVINTSDTTNSPTVNSGDISSSGDNYPLGHNGYALEATTPSGGSGNCSSIVTSDTCTVSAMADMTLYTPINGSSATSFDVPLFNLPQEYAGKVITVSAFDPGDAGGGAAYIGILQPAYTNGGTSSPLEFATLTTNSSGAPNVADVGNSLASGTSTDIAVNAGSNPNNYPYSGNSAIIQTASSSGGTAIYNGQWVQFTIQVPSNYNSSASGAYWDLYYQVASSAYAGDTLAFEVQYLGSPVHLLPNYS